MMKTVRCLIGLVASVAVLLAITGCADDVRTTKKVTTHEQEPVRMVSPGTEVVE